MFWQELTLQGVFMKKVNVLLKMYLLVCCLFVSFVFLSCGQEEDSGVEVGSNGTIDINNTTQSESNDDEENENSNTNISRLPAPTNVSAEAEDDSSIYVSWESVSGATSYVVYWRECDDISTDDYKMNGTELSISVSSTSTIVTGLQPSTIYSFWVKAKNSSGVGECSCYGIATIAATEFSSGSSSSYSTKIPAPTGLSATAKGRVLTISWNPVSEATEYCIYFHKSRTSTPRKNSIYSGYATDCSYTVPAEIAVAYEFEFDTTYYIYIMALGSKGYSDFSSCTVKTEKAIAPNLKIINNASIKIKKTYLFTTTGNTSRSDKYTHYSGESCVKGGNITFSIEDTSLAFKQILFVTATKIYSYTGTFKIPASGAGTKTITITDENLEYIGTL